MEVVTTGLFTTALCLVGWGWTLPAYLWFVSVTVVLAFIDLHHRRIPNRILLPGTAVAVALLAGGAALEGRIGDLPEALVAGTGYFAVLLVAALLARGAIGMGDVKLAFMLGTFRSDLSWWWRPGWPSPGTSPPGQDRSSCRLVAAGRLRLYTIYDNPL